MGVVVLSLNEALTQEVQSDVWSLIIFYLKESIGPGLIIIEAEVWHMGVHYIVLVSLLLCIFETFQNKKIKYIHAYDWQLVGNK